MKRGEKTSLFSKENQTAIFANKLVIAFIILLILCVNLALAQAQEVKVTLEHPFLINGKWIPASELKVGDLLTTADGKKARITYIKDVVLDSPVNVYNLEAGEYSNFILPGEVVVHNSGKPSIPEFIIECSGGACSGRWCFSGDTLILMSNGCKKKIEDIRVGDKVLSWDFSLNRTITGVVGNVSINLRGDLYVINNKIKVSPDHAFYTKEVGWSSINGKNEVWDQRLMVGYHLMDFNGNFIRINSIIPLNETIKTYNLINIQNSSNYFAGDVLVHNEGCAPLWKEIQSPSPNQQNKILEEFRRLWILGTSFDSAGNRLPGNLIPGMRRISTGQYKDTIIIDRATFRDWDKIPELKKLMDKEKLDSIAFKRANGKARGEGVGQTLQELQQEVDDALRINQYFEKYHLRHLFTKKYYFGFENGDFCLARGGIIIEENGGTTILNLRNLFKLRKTELNSRVIQMNAEYNALKSQPQTTETILKIQALEQEYKQIYNLNDRINQLQRLCARETEIVYSNAKLAFRDLGFKFQENAPGGVGEITVGGVRTEVKVGGCNSHAQNWGVKFEYQGEPITFDQIILQKRLNRITGKVETVDIPEVDVIVRGLDSGEIMHVGEGKGEFIADITIEKP